MTKKRIRWDSGEKNTVAKNIAAYLLNNPGATLPAAYNAINNCLPKDRRRTLAAVQQFDDLLPLIKEMMRKEQPPEVQLVEKEVIIPLKLENISTDELQSELHRRQLKPILEELALRVAQQVISYVSVPIVHPSMEPKEQLQKVLIVGLIGDQQNQIKQHFDGVYKFLFHKDGNMHRLKDAAKSCDIIILMSKFIGHDMQSAVNSIGVPTTICKGGMSELQKMLEALYMKKESV